MQHISWVMHHSGQTGRLLAPQDILEQTITLCTADVKDRELYSKRAQHSSPVGESKKGLQASSAAESHKKLL